MAAFAVIAWLSARREGETAPGPPPGGAGGGFPNPGANTLGIRSNNPGNIVKSSIQWQGKVNCPGRFECFQSMYWGVRALAINLQSYYFNRGLTTVNEIISRWAPPIENDTGAYIRFVSGRMGIDPYHPFEWNRRNIERLITAIIDMENGTGAAGVVGGGTIRRATNDVL